MLELQSGEYLLIIVCSGLQNIDARTAIFEYLLIIVCSGLQNIDARTAIFEYLLIIVCSGLQNIDARTAISYLCVKSRSEKLPR